MREAERSEAPLTVDTRVDTHRAVTEVTLYTADHPGLFSRIAGALALAGANIVDAKILTLSNGMALDTFSVQDQSGGAFDRADKLAKLAVLFENVLAGKVKPHVELAKPGAIPSRTRVFTVPPRVLIDNKASQTHTVIEVNGRDRPGLLFHADARADRPQPADLERQDLDLRREGGRRLLREGHFRPQDRPRAEAQGDPRAPHRSDGRAGFASRGRVGSS